jgi:signal recognition particle receptor subunit beta
VSFINYSTHEISVKVVYYGPGLCGKTTNLQFIHSKASPEGQKLITLATEEDRTLFFDFLTLPLPTLHGFKIRLRLYTVPGQVYYDACRKLILGDLDGVVFVADSQVERMDANLESLDNLRENMAERGQDLSKVPLVVQYNKRDLPNVAPLDVLHDALNPGNAPEFPAVARTGEGVFPTLKAVSKLMLFKLKKAG